MAGTGARALSVALSEGEPLVEIGSASNHLFDIVGRDAGSLTTTSARSKY